MFSDAAGIEVIYDEDAILQQPPEKRMKKDDSVGEWEIPFQLLAGGKCRSVGAWEKLSILKQTQLCWWGTSSLDLI